MTGRLDTFCVNDNIGFLKNHICVPPTASGGYTPTVDGDGHFSLGGYGNRRGWHSTRNMTTAREREKNKLENGHLEKSWHLFSFIF
jgi:hypothetical protein